MKEGYKCKECEVGKVYFYQRCKYEAGKYTVLYSFAECNLCKNVTDIPEEAKK